jgi:hypothetical protein
MEYNDNAFDRPVRRWDGEPAEEPHTATRIKDYRTRRSYDGRGVPYAESAAGEYCL